MSTKKRKLEPKPKYLLIKNKDGMQTEIHFDCEQALSQHLRAMWAYTDWHLVAVVKL
jgi:hypothetical protein